MPDTPTATHATIKLYYGSSSHPWMLTANKFFVIDDIETYLSTYNQTCTTFNNFQYQKCTLELSIVCDLSQTYVEPLLINGIKYVSIKNSDANKIYYYYVKRAEWRGKASVKLYLVMDVANTFRSGTDFDFTERTKITREHKSRLIPETYISKIVYDYSETTSVDIAGLQENVLRPYTLRFYDYEFGPLIKTISCTGIYKPSNNTIEFTNLSDEDAEWIKNYENPEFAELYIIEDGYVASALLLGVPKTSLTYSYSNRYTRKIDYQSEGLTPILYKKEEQLINREGILNCDWYLLYRNQNDPTEALTNPVECYLIPSNDIEVNIGSIQSGGRINPDNLEYGKYYYIHILKDGRYESEVKSVVLSDGTNYTTYVGGSMYPYAYYYFIIYKASDDKITIITRVKDANNDNYLLEVKTIDYFQVSPLPFTYYTSSTFNANGEYPAGATEQQWTTEGTTQYMIDNIDKLDRTDAKNIKLIKLPYIPYNFEVVDNVLILTDTDFEHISLVQTGGGVIEILRLKNLNIKFNYDFNIGISPLSVLNIGTHEFNVNDLRNDFYESKLFHSDYYQPKFVYDSFGYVFQLERFNLNYIPLIDNLNNMKVKYVVSTTINSRFMFQFVEYQSLMGKEDYNNVMPVARNNELVLYNVPYINYIRTGFNYDVKTKNTQMASTWASVGMGALGTAVALAFPSAVLKIAGVAASLISTALSVKNAIVSQVEAERNLDQKMLQAKNEATSVSNADDVDLMSVYTGNRAKICKYECSDITKALLCDLFFYTGYVSNRMGIPNTNTRVNFDYLEADIIITDYVNMSDEIANELTGLYKNGLTFIHKVQSRVSDMWDLEQKYENFEVNTIE